MLNAALLAHKSNAHPVQLSDRSHALIENRHDLVVDFKLTVADGYGERDAPQAKSSDRSGAHQKTIGANKNDDTRVFVAAMAQQSMAAPHAMRATPNPSMPAVALRRSLAGLGSSLACASSYRGRWPSLSGHQRRGHESVSAVVGLHVIADNLIHLGNIL